MEVCGFVGIKCGKKCQEVGSNEVGSWELGGSYEEKKFVRR